jgi:hypothetical protein
MAGQIPGIPHNGARGRVVGTLRRAHLPGGAGPPPPRRQPGAARCDGHLRRRDPVAAVQGGAGTRQPGPGGRLRRAPVDQRKLETTNEELQSTVEELETTNEEFQSTNQELDLNRLNLDLGLPIDQLLPALRAAMRGLWHPVGHGRGHQSARWEGALPGHLPPAARQRQGHPRGDRGGAGAAGAGRAAGGRPTGSGASGSVRVRGLEPLTRRLAADVADLGAPC